MDFGEPSQAAVSEAPSHVVAMQKAVDSLEREKMHMLEKLQELESSNITLKKENETYH